MKTHTFLFLLLLTMVVLMGTGALAQAQGKARIFGSVVDRSGRRLPHLQILATLNCKCSDCTDPEQCRCCSDSIRVTTTAEGRFDLSINPGTYFLRAGKTEVQVTISPGEERAVNMVAEE
jgi:hypothetical protein